MSQNSIPLHDPLELNINDKIPDVDHLYLQCLKLTPEGKALLIGRLMQSNTSQIVLNFGGDKINSPIILQIQSFDKSQIAELIETLAQRFK